MTILPFQSRAIPSREFMIRQATLNTAAYGFPATYKVCGNNAGLTLANLWHSQAAQEIVIKDVRKHFRILANQYGVEVVS